MITLVEIDENNWLEAVRLQVKQSQQGFLDRAIGILARGYVYRSCNARIFGIAHEQRLVGLALVRDCTEEPTCYDLQQFMIDGSFQNRGYGTQALEQLMQLLEKEGRFSCVEVCVHREDAPALRLYQKAGFADTGYIDADAPECLNLMAFFPQKA